MKYTDTQAFQEQAEKESNGNVKEYLKIKEKVDAKESKLTDALEVLQNTHSSEVTPLLAHVLRMQHRTHQQCIIHNLYEMLKIYAQNDTDLRNECAVAWAKYATEEEHYFPFI